MKDEEMMALARKRVAMRQGFKIHFTCYAATGIFLILIWIITGAGYFWPIWPIGGWGIGVAIHGTSISLYSNGKVNAEKIELEYRKIKAQEDNECDE